MAIIGFIILLGAGLYAVYMGIVGARMCAAFGIPSWSPLLISVIGAAIIYAACHFAPFTIQFSQ